MSNTGAQHLLVIAVLFCLIVLVMAAFNEVPMSQEVPVGTEAVFRCRHPTADTISWMVNGTFIGANPPPDITPDNIRDGENNLVHTLAIVARPQYNGTIIVCVAEFRGGTPDETTASVVLLVQGTFTEVPVSQTVFVGDTATFRCRHSMTNNFDWILNGTIVINATKSMPGIVPGMMSESGNMVNTLNIIGQRDYNTTVVVARARLLASSSEDSQPAMLQVFVSVAFIEVPQSLNVAVGKVAVFQCRHLDTTIIGWTVNGASLSSNPQNSGFRSSSEDGVHSLTITTHSRYNSSVIQCIAIYLDDRLNIPSPAAVLQIQGPLDAVKNLTKFGSTVSWKPPYSLDLTNIDPDIVYCVDVYNITCGGRDLVSSDCSVTDTNYTSLSDGYLYEYIVTPRSNVEGAENGTASHIRDVLPEFSVSSSQVSISSSDSSTNYQVELVYNQSPGVPIPSSYALSLEALDGLGDLDHVEATATEIQPNLLLSVTGLESRRLWNCTILAFGCREHSLASTLLSTHDFQDISISSPSAGVVRVTGRFVEGSSSAGVLVIVNSDSGVIYHISTRDGSGSHAVTISGLAGGDYTVSVFVVEENGLPFERAAIIPGHLFVETNTVEPPPPTIEYSLESTSTGVCVQCNFLATDSSECIAVVHAHDLVNIQSSHKFTRSGDTASGCIEGVNLEVRQIGVVGGRQLNTGPARSSNLTVIIVALVPTVALLAVIVFVLLIIVKVYYGIYRKHHGPGDVEKTQNHYTSVPAPPTENPRDPLVVQSVDRSVGISPSSTPSSSFTDNTQASTVSTSVSESSTEDGNIPFYSTVDVKPKPSSPSDASQTSTSVTDSAKESGISPLYSQVDVKPQPVSVPPVDDKRVLYSEVMKTQGAKDQLYTMVNPKKSMCTNDCYPDDLTKVVYSEICPHVVELPPQATTVKIIPTAPKPTPFTADSVVAALLPVASKWLAIGEAFPVSQKRLDDIETTEGDEQCLQEMIKAYMLRRDLKHTWDEIVNVLKNKKVKEERLAEQIFDMHVAPYIVTLPNQPQLPKRDMYTPTCGSKPLPPVHKVCTDGGSLDTSSPVLSDQQTEPPTSLSSEEEVKLDKDESLPTPDEAVCTHEVHRSNAVLEIPPLSTDDEHFNKPHPRSTERKRRIAADGDSTEMENDDIEATNEVQEVKCESDSGVSEDLPSPTMDDDILTYATDGEKFSGVSHENQSEDTSQPGGRTGPPLPIQVATPDSNCMPQKELMEDTIDDLVLPQPPFDEVSTCFQEREPHENYFRALAHQLGKEYVQRETDYSQGEVELLTTKELPNEPVKESDILNSVYDPDSSQHDDVQTSLQELVPTHNDNTEMCTMLNVVNGNVFTEGLAEQGHINDFLLVDCVLMQCCSYLYSARAPHEACHSIMDYLQHNMFVRVPAK